MFAEKIVFVPFKRKDRIIEDSVGSITIIYPIVEVARHIYYKTYKAHFKHVLVDVSKSY